MRRFQISVPPAEGTSERGQASERRRGWGGGVAGRMRRTQGRMERASGGRKQTKKARKVWVSEYRHALRGPLRGQRRQGVDGSLLPVSVERSGRAAAAQLL
eukprot:scaffold3123_cov105-Isochrysis_galbana.AAC.1